jgi:enediyne biosynthesis protein E4
MTPTIRRFAPILLAAAVACGKKPAAAPTVAAVPPPAPKPVDVGLRFEDVTAASGIDFVHVTGAVGKKWLPETLGAGCAVFDADGDGKLDLYFANGRSWNGGRETGRLFRNATGGDGALRYTDATAASGLAVPMYAMGALATDLDGDGDQDLVVTGLDEVRVFANDGRGRFSDRTKGSGLPASGWWTAAVASDVDGDGRLDLFLGRYVDWSPPKDLVCKLDGVTKSYCTPERYPSAQSRLYLGDGALKFRDVTDAAGMGGEPLDKTLGAAALDVDGDGRIDLAVANDTQPNRLWRNRGGEPGAPKFEDVGTTSGMGVDENGKARGAMGVSWATLRPGAWSLAIGNFSNEMISLYTTTDGEFFADDAIPSGVGTPSLLPLKFGVRWGDFDGDGRDDLAVANGHVEPTIQKVQASVTYEQSPMLFHATGDGKLSPLSADEAGALGQPMVGRGLAVGDLDGDGSLDLVLTANGGAPRILLNRSASGSRTVRIRLAGEGGNRDAVGAVVSAKAGDVAQRRVVAAGDSYLSTSVKELTFGLGAAKQIEAIEVIWPDGKKVMYPPLGPGAHTLKPDGTMS